eukprot:6064144-Amphidinium_carterae.1
MEVGTGKKRAAEEEADDSERTARGAVDLTVLTSAGKQGRGMLALSLLLADGATVLNGQSQYGYSQQFNGKARTEGPGRCRLRILREGRAYRRDELRKKEAGSPPTWRYLSLSEGQGATERKELRVLWFGGT